jgi:hypothetical protein
MFLRFINKSEQWNFGKLFAAAVFGGFCLAGRVSAQVNYTVSFDDPDGTYSAYYSEIETDVLGAGAAWSKYLIGNTTISLQIDFDDEPTASGASSTTQFVGTNGDFNVFAQGAGYKVATGEDPGVDVDGVINIGTSYLQNDLWFDPDPYSRTAPVPDNMNDAVSVFIHELGHIFAFNGWRDGETGELPGNYESPFDEDVVTEDTAGGTTSFFTGANAETVYGGPVPMTFGDYPHFGNEPPRPGSDLINNELMNGVVFFFGQRYYISPLDLAVLEDVGVPVNTLLLLGDTNDDGKIDGADLAVLNADMGLSVTNGYAGGDFNGDGVVNGDDFALFQLGLASYNASVGNPLPEPACGVVLGLAVVLLSRRRRGSNESF